MKSSKIRIASFAFALLLGALAVTQVLADEAGAGSEQEIEAAAVETVPPVEDPAPPAVEEREAVFYLDGAPLYDVVAQKFNGTYYVTLRSILPLVDSTAVVEELNGRASATAQAVAVTEEGNGLAKEAQSAAVEVLDTLTISAATDDIYLTANGRCLYLKDGVKALDGAVAVPIRVLGRILGLAVWYEAPTGRVYLASSEQPGYLADASEFYDQDDLYWLARIIHRESGNQPLEGKLAVGNVVLNRVASPLFPDSVYDVLLQKNQFVSDDSKLTCIDPSEESVVAAMLALEGATALEGVLFFNRAGMSCFASRNRPYIATIGAHAFYG